MKITKSEITAFILGAFLGLIIELVIYIMK